MSEINEHPLIAATRRVMNALDALERNIHQSSVAHDRAENNEQKLTLFIRENESLKQEKANLTSAINQLTRQYEDLQNVTSNIHARLDDSARRITEILEG